MAVGVSTAEITKILKLDYQGPIREQLINKNVLLSLLKRDYSRGTFQGSKSVIPMHVGRNIGRGWRAEDQIIPPAGQQSHEQVFFHMAYLYGRIGITGQAIAISRNDKGAFARALDLEMRGLVTDLAITMQKAVWSDGSGRLTDLCGVGSATPDLANINKSGKTKIQVKSNRWVEKGMPVFVGLRSGVSSGGADKAFPFATQTVGSGGPIPACHVTAVGEQSTSFDSLNHATTNQGATITLDQASDHVLGLTGAVTDANNYSLYLFGSRDIGTAAIAAGGALPGSHTAWTTPTEIWGLQALVSDANPSFYTDANSSYRSERGLVGEMDRTVADNSYWKANVVDNAGVEVDNEFDKFQEAYDTSEIQGDFTPGLCLTSYRVRRKLADSFATNRRFGTEKDLKAGWTGLQFNNSLIVCDKDAHDPGDPRDADIWELPTTHPENNDHFNDCYFLSREAMHWTIMEDLSWEDTGGVIVREGVGALAKDRYEAYMKSYLNLVITEPKKFTILKNVQ